MVMYFYILKSHEHAIPRQIQLDYLVYGYFLMEINLKLSICMSVCIRKSKKMNCRLISPIIMAKCFLLLIVSAAICQSSFAQSDTKIDSLLNVLKTAKEDSNRVFTLISLGGLLQVTSRYVESKYYTEEALVLAKKLNLINAMGEAYTALGIVYGRQGDHSSSLENFIAANKIFEEIGNKKGIVASYNNIGLCYSSQNNYPEAMKNHQAAIKMGEETGNKQAIAYAYNSMGVIYMIQGNLPEAMKNYQTALKIAEEIGDNQGIASSYFTIGSIYKNQGNLPEALKNYLAALKTAEVMGSKYNIALIYNAIGKVYATLDNDDEALKMYMASLKIREDIGLKNTTSNIYISIGIIYNDQGNYPEALKNYFAALKIAEEFGDKREIVASYSNIGTTYIQQDNFPEALKNFQASMKIAEEIGDNRSIAHISTLMGMVYGKLNENVEAEKYLLKGLSLSKEIGDKQQIIDAYNGLTDLNYGMGYYQQALEHYKLSRVYFDSIFNENNSKQVLQLKEQYESEIKDKEILHLESDKQKLESEKLISSLLLTTKQDSLNIAQSEKEKVQLENEKFFALNLSNQQQLELLENEKQLRELQSGKDKAEADKNKEQLALLSKEKEIRELELKKQKLTKNYFIGGLGLFLVLSFFIYRNYRTSQELKLLSLRNKIAIDLHDDVGSTLSSISMFSQMAQAQSKEIIPALETIGESSRKMLDAMADIVWTIKPENDEFDKVIMRMREFAFELLGAKAIDFEFDAGNDISKINLSMESRKNLYLIFKEATNNMVKYSEANRAKFALKGEKDKFMMVISDNGKGFDASKEYRGNGLMNMKKRAVEMGAQLWIDSAPGSGTTIKLELAV